MTKIDFAEGFVEDMLKVRLESKRKEIFGKVELLEYAPEIGSRILSASVRQRYGSDVLKLVVNPFEVIYRYRREDDLVQVMGLLHQSGRFDRSGGAAYYRFCV